MKKKLLVFPLVLAILVPSLAMGAAPDWPTLSQQLQAGAVEPRSALEALIAANQDFSLLRPEEAKDKIRIPLWLRVLWRRAHPEMVYSAADPTGGYPLVLKEVHEWMATHQDLVPGPAEKDTGPGESDAEAAAKSAGVAGEKRISGFQTAARSESDIRVNYWDPLKIIAASNNISGGGSQAQFYSTDGGATWGQTTLPLITGDAFQSDPTVDWTSDGTAWATTIGIDSSGSSLRMRSYKSTDNGATWTFDATFSGTHTSADKQMVWVDHSATSPYRDNIYAIWHNGTPAYMTRRTGPAGSWQTPVRVSGAESTGTAIGADVKTNAYGDVFGFWPATGNRGIFVVKSANGGVSYGTPVRIATAFGSFTIGVPSFNGRRILIYVSGGAYRTASKNLVYATWTDLTGASGCDSASNEPGSNATSPCKSRIWFSRSADGGATWSVPAMINNQDSRNDQFNQWMVVDETTGALAIIYYDTVGDPGRKKVDIWYQSSYDDGATWQPAVKLTSTQTDETVPGAESGNQFGDYNGLSGIAGQFFPSWTDRRNNAREEIWTAKVTDNTCAFPGAPLIGSASAIGPNQIRITWGNGAPGSGAYNVYRAPGACAAPGTFTRIASSVAGTSQTDSTVSGGTTYAYYVRGLDATGRCESGPSGCVQATATGACTLPPSFAGLASVASLGTSTCGLALSWPAATPACSGPVTYNVYRGTAAGFTPGVENRIAGGLTGTGYTDVSAVHGTTYHYIVRAVGVSNGLEEGNSVERSATPAGPLAVFLDETFEAPLGFDDPGWTHAAIGGGSGWTWSTDVAKSPTHSRFSDSLGVASERFLTSPSFVTRVGTRLSFWHTYLFEDSSTCFDGGTLEVTTDGGSTWTVVPDSAFLTGGFNGTVVPISGNPLAGKRAWCHGALGPMTQVVVDLSAFAGSNTARVRWHEGDDAAAQGIGWYVDSVILSNPEVCIANEIFSDGFEGGVLPGLWSGTTP